MSHLMTDLGVFSRSRRYLVERLTVQEGKLCGRKNRSDSNVKLVYVGHMVIMDCFFWYPFDTYVMHTYYFLNYFILNPSFIQKLLNNVSRPHLSTTLLVFNDKIDVSI